MTRYHFHTSDGVVFRDEDGEDLATLDHACAAAVQILTEMLPGHREAFLRSGRFSVNVKDATGRLVVVLTTTLTTDASPNPADPPRG